MRHEVRGEGEGEAERGMREKVECSVDWKRPRQRESEECEGMERMFN